MVRFFLVVSVMLILSASVRAFSSSSVLKSAVRNAARVAPSSNLALHAEKEKTETRNLVEQAGAASMTAAAAAAVAAVNQAVGMRTLEAPDNKKSYVQAGQNVSAKVQIDEVGLPLVYDKDAIQTYWKDQGGALTKRWGEFLGLSLPLFTKVASTYVRDGTLSKQEAQLARDARVVIEKLGPTYVKMGQMMSVRPDVLPDAALAELRQLQDNVEGFPTEVAVAQIEAELGGPLGQFFSEISEEPVAAASLAQVYRARLQSTGEVVAIKVQRPAVLETVSKDLYVLRRAAAVYQGVVERFAPQQRTDYEALLNEWAVGFYTELNFMNEAANQMKFRELLKGTGLYVPKVYTEYTTRRVLVSEWVDGDKLSNSSPEEIGRLIPAAQEAFLIQLLQEGFFHADPHPGNILVMDQPRDGCRMALIDYGLVATVEQGDRDTMISSLIHLANKDYPSLVDDFVSLGILPDDCDRSLVVPLMDKALSPYVKGGGAKRYEAEIRRQYGMGETGATVGGLQAMTNDALTVLNDIPFSIPPYFAILGRAIVTLEGVALVGNPDYSIIMEAYPFVARRLLSEDRPEIQRALQEVLYSAPAGGGGGGGGGGALRTSRLTALLNAAMGVAADGGGGGQKGGAFIDLDSDGELDLAQALRFLAGREAGSLRALLEEEAASALDLLSRQAARKSFGALAAALQTRPRLPVVGGLLPFNPLPRAPDLGRTRLPFLLPDPSRLPSAFSSMLGAAPGGAAAAVAAGARALGTSGVSTLFTTPEELLEGVAPRLTREEEIYALSLTDLVRDSFGEDAAAVAGGDVALEPAAALRFFLSLTRGGASSSSALGGVLTSAFERLGGAGDAQDSQQIEELLGAYSSMEPEEQDALRRSADAVLQKLAARLEERLGTFVAVGRR